MKVVSAKLGLAARAEALLESGHEVFVIDDLSTGTIENIEHLKGRGRFHYVVGSIMNVPLLAELVDRCERDGCAGRGHAPGVP